MTETEKQLQEIEQSMKIVVTGSKIITTKSFALPSNVRQMIAETFARRNEREQKEAQSAVRQ